MLSKTSSSGSGIRPRDTSTDSFETNPADAGVRPHREREIAGAWLGNPRSLALRCCYHGCGLDRAARQRRRHHEATLVDDAMHALTWLRDVRLGSDTHCSLQESSGSAMSEATQEFARRVAQIHLFSGKDSHLHPEAAVRELLRDRAMNYGSSHGQVTLAPCQRGRVSFQIREVEEMVSARGRLYLEGLESEFLQTRILVSGLPAQDYGIATHASTRTQGNSADLFATSSPGDLWCSDDGASRKLDSFLVFGKTNKLRLILPTQVRKG